ncbi:MAG: hypothetical protein ACP5SI_05945 [Chloroflexia bacterium]
MAADLQNGAFAPLPWLHRTSREDETEQELLRELGLSAPASIIRETLIHYYISAKSWPLVVLGGPERKAGRRYFELLSRAIVGCCQGQARGLSAQLPSDVRGGERTADTIQDRYYWLGLLDVLVEARTPGSEGRAFWVCLEDLTVPQLLSYLQAWETFSAGDDRPPWPSNLFLSALVPSFEGLWDLDPDAFSRIGIVEVPVSPDPAADTRPPCCPPVGWQRFVLRTMIREPAVACERLARLGLVPRLQEMLHLAEPLFFREEGDRLRADLFVYAANSFSGNGQGLLDPSPEGNLREAVDLQLAQRVLPYVQRRFPDILHQTTWLERLSGLFPRARARAQRLHLESLRAEQKNA